MRTHQVIAIPQVVPELCFAQRALMDHHTMALRVPQESHHTDSVLGQRRLIELILLVPLRIPPEDTGEGTLNAAVDPTDHFGCAWRCRATGRPRSLCGITSWL